MNRKYKWTLLWQKNNLVPLLKEKDSWKFIEEYYRKFRLFSTISKLIFKKFSINAYKKISPIVDVGGGMTSLIRITNALGIVIDPLAQDYSILIPYPKRINPICSIGENIPLRSNSIKMVSCTNVLDHTENPEQLIKEINRILVQNGILYLTCEIFRKDLGARNEGHPHTFTQKKIINMLKLNNFEIILKRKTRFFGIYFWLRKQMKKEPMNKFDVIPNTKSIGEMVIVCTKI